MTVHVSPSASKDSVIRYLVLLNGVVILALIASITLSYKLFEGITVSTPPDLRQGAVLRPGVKYPEDVFAFTVIKFGAIQTWRDDGSKDYEDNIDTFEPFITSDFRLELLEDFKEKKRRGELREVKRKLSLPNKYVFRNDESIRVVDNNTWIVFVPFEITETTGGVITKDIEVLYSFVVRRSRSDVQTNVHQIAIDSFYQVPIRTKDFLSKTVIKQNTEKLIDEL